MALAVRGLLAVILLVCGGGLAAAQQPAATQPPAEPSHEEPDFPRLHISGFTDFNFTAASKAEGSRGFSEGQFALHFVSELSPRVSFFGEISLTARGDAGMGSPPATGFNAEVERSILRFDQSDQLKVSFGRYHTPINWWNTAYHHGQWLQTTPRLRQLRINPRSPARTTVRDRHRLRRTSRLRRCVRRR